MFSTAQAYKDETLSEEKITVLEEMGFDWSFKETKKANQTIWEARFDELVEVSGDSFIKLLTKMMLGSRNF